MGFIPIKFFQLLSLIIQQSESTPTSLDKVWKSFLCISLLLFQSDFLEGKEKIYEIKLTDRNDKYIVTAHKVDKLEKISYDDARTILKHIVSAYGSSIAKN